MTAKIKLNAASGGGSVSLEAPSATTGNANVEFKLPVADGSNGQALTTNASGQLAFATISSNPTTTSGTDNFTVADGDLVIGTSGHGIDFSATADGSGVDSSELLDDYEEGTWTPTAINFNLNTTYNATYTKIGRLVHVNTYMEATNTSNGSAVSIGGLPYNVTSTSSYHGIGACRIGGQGGNARVIQFNSNTDQCSPRVSEGTLSGSSISYQHIIFSGSYITD